MLVHGFQDDDIPSPVARSVASPTADRRVGIFILAQSHTFMEIDYEIISTVILLLQQQRRKPACASTQFDQHLCYHFLESKL